MEETVFGAAKGGSNDESVGGAVGCSASLQEEAAAAVIEHMPGGSGCLDGSGGAPHDLTSAAAAQASSTAVIATTSLLSATTGAAGAVVATDPTVASNRLHRRRVQVRTSERRSCVLSPLDPFMTLLNPLAISILGSVGRSVGCTAAPVVRLFLSL